VSERDELSARYEVLCKRINALNADIGLEMDRERRVTLDERRTELTKERDAIGAQLALVSWQKPDGNDVTGTQQMMDARILMTETTLRGLDTKMDKLIDQVHDIDTRQRVLEQQVLELKKQIDDVRNQVVLVRAWNDSTDLPRTWLLAGGMAVLLALVMLIVITYRVM
jgi:chromosome segregation ATPase